MIQRDLGDGAYASYDEPASPPAGHEDADPGRPLYPGVTVHLSTGCPANMGSVMDKVRDALRQAGEDTDVMNRIWAEVFEAGSFTEALSIVMRWVNVT